MTKLLLLAATLGACAAQQPSTPLHQLGDSTLELVSFGGQVSVELKVKGTGCPMLAEEVSATFDGVPMDVSRGGYAETSDGCYPIGFTISPSRLDGVATYEAGSANTDLVIEDKTTRWTIASTRLFTNQFDIDTAGSRIVWQNVTAITSAQLTPAVAVQIEGNIIHYPPGTNVTAVSAYAHPLPTKCDGPGQCLVDLQGAHAFQPTPP
jgi:hypothetical protein